MELCSARLANSTHWFLLRPTFPGPSLVRGWYHKASLYAQCIFQFYVLISFCIFFFSFPVLSSSNYSSFVGSLVLCSHVTAIWFCFVDLMHFQISLRVLDEFGKSSSISLIMPIFSSIHVLSLSYDLFFSCVCVSFEDPCKMKEVCELLPLIGRKGFSPTCFLLDWEVYLTGCAGGWGKFKD